MQSAAGPYTAGVIGPHNRRSVDASHYINMSVVPIDRRLYCPIAVPTPTVGDGRRTVGATDMFLQ